MFLAELHEQRFAVLGYFWCDFAVIFFSKYGVAVFRVQLQVCGNFKFYDAVIGEKKFLSRGDLLRFFKA